MGARLKKLDGDALLPSEPLGQRLCRTFLSYEYQTIVANNKVHPQWRTVTTHRLCPRVLWKQWNDPALLVGVRFGSQTCYALIDIDAGSAHHPKQNSKAVAEIQAALEEIGICRTVLIRSSDSNGLHLYIPLPEAVSTYDLACALHQCLERQGMKITPGQLEIFPNCKSYATRGSFTEYNAHRLPLQPNSGSWLLDTDGNLLGQGLGEFFAYWDRAKAGQDIKALQQALSTARKNLKAILYCKEQSRGEKWRRDLETGINEGWTGPGQTNSLLGKIARYGRVFRGLSGEELVEFIHETAIQSTGYYRWCRHRQEIPRKAEEWARSAERKYWSFHSGPKPNKATLPDGEPSLNEQRANDAQQRIRQAVTDLQQQNKLPEAITARAAAIVSYGSTSKKTLYRYLHLWHPKYISPIEQGCKTDQSEPDVASYELTLESEPRSRKPSEDGEVYTSPPMKRRSGEEGVLPFIGKITCPPGSFTEQIALNLTPGEGLEPLIGILSQLSQLELSSTVKCSPALPTPLVAAQPDAVESASNYVSPTSLLPSTSSTNLSNSLVRDRSASVSMTTGNHSHPNAAFANQSSDTRSTQGQYAEFPPSKSKAVLETYLEPMFQKKERQHSDYEGKHIQRMQQFLDSGDPILVAEALDWAEANPGRLNLGRSPHLKDMYQNLLSKRELRQRQVRLEQQSGG